MRLGWIAPLPGQTHCTVALEKVEAAMKVQYFKGGRILALETSLLLVRKLNQNDIVAIDNCCEPRSRLSRGSGVTR
jgi:hypothetical protein